MPRIRFNGLPEEVFNENVRIETHRAYLRKKWKNKYNINIKPEQIDAFMEHKKIIEKILPILDLIKYIKR